MSHTFTLIRRDPATRVLPWIILAACLSWIGFWKNPGDTALGFMSGIAIPLLTFAQPQRRATLFEATLPIDGRDLLRARILSLLLYTCAPVSIVLLGAALFGHTPDPTAFLRIFAGILIVNSALVVSQMLLLPRLEIRAIVAVLLGFATVAGAVGVTFMPAWLLWPAIVAILVLMALLVSALWPKGPLSFEYPVRSGPGRSNSADKRVTTSPGGFLATQAPFLRALYPWQATMFLAMTAIYPVINMTAMPLLFLPGFFTYTLFGIRWLATLPISRRRLMLSVLAPYVLLYTLAILADQNYGFGAQNSRSAVLEYRHGSVQLDRESPHLVRTERNSHPVITAPWGETYQPGLFNRPRGAYYNPWASGRENSQRFQDWQFRRATLAVYGHELTLDAAASVSQLTPLLRQPGVQFLVVAIADTLVLFVIAMMLLPHWSRLNWLSQKVRKGIAMGIAFPIIFAVALLPKLTGYLPGVEVTDILARDILQGLPAGSSLAWLVPSAIILSLLWLIDRQFAELEPGLIEMLPKSRWGATSGNSAS